LPDRRFLVGGWVVALGSLVFFAWLTVGPYVRQNLQPQAGEADLAVRECGAGTSCDDLVDHQLSVLRQTRSVVQLSAWSISILAVVAVVIATVLVLRGRRGPLGLLWKVQLGGAALLLVVQIVFLVRGASALHGTPISARMVTFITAFDGPFTDAGHLYYLVWFAGVGLVAALLTRALRQSRSGPFA
jgi:hypothetical protein